MLYGACYFDAFCGCLDYSYGICTEIQWIFSEFPPACEYVWWIFVVADWGFIPIVTLSLIFSLVNKSHAIDRTLINSQLAAPLSPPLCVCSLREVQSSGPSMRTAGSVSALSTIIKAQKILRPPAACNQIHTFQISDPYFSTLGKRFLRHQLLNWTLMASATFISFYLSFF